MKKVSVLTVILAFIFCLFITDSATVDAERVYFKDVNQSNSHYDGIYYLTNEGIINGYGDNTYRPGDSITRSQTAALFTRALSLPIPSNKANFLKNYKDISTNHTYADEIAATYKANIFTGSNGYFNDGSLTREQMASVLVRAYGLKDNGEKVNAKLSNVGASHRENVKILFQYGITNQTGDFRPRQTVTRGQFATFLYRVAENVEDSEESNDNKFDELKVFTSKDNKFYIYGIALGDSRSNVIKKLGKPDIEKIDDSDAYASEFVLIYDNFEVYITDNSVDFMLLDISYKFFNKEFKGKYIDKEYIGENVDYLYDSESSHLVYAKYDNDNYNVRLGYADGNFDYGLENGTIKPVQEQEVPEKDNEESNDENVQSIPDKILSSFHSVSVSPSVARSGDYVEVNVKMSEQIPELERIYVRHTSVTDPKKEYSTTLYFDDIKNLWFNDRSIEIYTEDKDWLLRKITFLYVDENGNDQRVYLYREDLLDNKNIDYVVNQPYDSFIDIIDYTFSFVDGAFPNDLNLSPTEGILIMDINDWYGEMVFKNLSIKQMNEMLYDFTMEHYNNVFGVNFPYIYIYYQGNYVMNAVSKNPYPFSSKDFNIEFNPEYLENL